MGGWVVLVEGGWFEVDVKLRDESRCQVVRLEDRISNKMTLSKGLPGMPKREARSSKTGRHSRYVELLRE